MLKDSIRSLGRYTEKQALVFDALIDESVGNITHFSISNISKKIQVTRPTIYNTLKTFQRDGILIKDKKIGTFKFEKETLDIIIQLYLKKRKNNLIQKM